jgi:hypothetical protein
MNGNNSLTDGVGKQNNACLYINGHATFKGTGSLTVTSPCDKQRLWAEAASEEAATKRRSIDFLEFIMLFTV